MAGVSQNDLETLLKENNWPYVAIVSREVFWELQTSYAAETHYDTTGGRVYFMVGPTRIVAKDADPATVEVDLGV